MKRGQKRTKNQKRRDAKALRLIQNAPPALLKHYARVLYSDRAPLAEVFARGTKADLITLKLWS